LGVLNYFFSLLFFLLKTKLRHKDQYGSTQTSSHRF
jgi:hypothetical protein